MSKWIGVDLDATLAKHSGKAGSIIGAPLPSMMKRVKAWIKDGKRVKIFTARADSPKEVLKVKKWLDKHGLSGLEVTNKKDWEMQELWDDRAIRVSYNKGDPCAGCIKSSKFSGEYITDC